MYLVMEYCEGGELYEEITKKSEKGLFKEKHAVEIIEKMLRALRHCNENKIAHRDIKPENIMIAKDGEVKLIGFGLPKPNKSKY
jgi:serine/threonine protein kinase